MVLAANVSYAKSNMVRLLLLDAFFGLAWVYMGADSQAITFGSY